VNTGPKGKPGSREKQRGDFTTEDMESTEEEGRREKEKGKLKSRGVQKFKENQREKIVYGIRVGG